MTPLWMNLRRWNPRLFPPPPPEPVLPERPEQPADQSDNVAMADFFDEASGLGEASQRHPGRL